MSGSVRKGTRYSEALAWIALNDDTDWVGEDCGHASVTACLVADVFGKDLETVVEDLRACLKRLELA